MKIVNQLLCGVHIAAAAEALVLARGLGIDPAAALEALGAGAAASFMLGDRGPRIAQQLVGESPEVRSRLDIFVKDLGLVAEAAERAGLTLPVAGAAEQLFRLGETRGLAGLDDSGVSLVARVSRRDAGAPDATSAGCRPDARSSPCAHPPGRRTGCAGGSRRAG